MTDEQRRRGLEVMAQVYGWDVSDGPGAFFGVTVDHLFAEVWTHDGLTFHDRRLLLLGLMVATGQDDLAAVQVGAALRNGELEPDELREIVVFLAHYAGWPRAATFNNVVEKGIAEQRSAGT